MAIAVGLLDCVGDWQQGKGVERGTNSSTLAAVSDFLFSHTSATILSNIDKLDKKRGVS